MVAVAISVGFAIEELMMIEPTTTAVPNEGSSSKGFNGQRTDPSDGLAWEDRLYEIVHGERVEKPMGFYEVGIACILGYYLEHFARTGQLGRVRVEMMF